MEGTKLSTNEIKMVYKINGQQETTEVFLHKHLIKLKEEKTKPTKTMQKLYSRLINILKLSA